MSELHVVPVSGGKDSTCLALWLKENEPRDYVYVTTPTGNELPDWWEHMRHLGGDNMLGKPIIPIIGGTLSGLIEKWNALPNWRQRWCTRQLKIEPFAAWMMQQTGSFDKITCYIGLRADEEEREGGDYSDVPGVERRCPLREIGFRESDVWDFLNTRGVSIPPRTDCAWCYAQRLDEWWSLWKDWPALYAEAEAREEKTGHTFRSPGRDSWPASLKELRLMFEAGAVPKKNQQELFSMKCRVCR